MQIMRANHGDVAQYCLLTSRRIVLVSMQRFYFAGETPFLSFLAGDMAIFCCSKTLSSCQIH